MGLMEDTTGIPEARWDAETVRTQLDFALIGNSDDASDLLLNRQYAALVYAMRASKVIGAEYEAVAEACNALSWEIDVWLGSQNPAKCDRPKTWEEFLTPDQIELAVQLSEA